MCLLMLLLMLQCAELIRSSSSSSPAIQRQRWAAVGDVALQKGCFTLAAAAFWVDHKP